MQKNAEFEAAVGILQILTEIREEYDDYSELISKQRDTYNALTSGKVLLSV